MKKLYLLIALFFCAFATPALATNCAVANGTCFWIGGTGTMDLATDSAHWSNTTGGTTCSCEPISSNLLTLDGTSGGGIVTTNANFTVAGIDMSAFTGTLDISAHNNNLTLGNNAVVVTAFKITGTSTRTLNCGSGTIALVSSGGGNIWDATTQTGLTMSCSSGTISIAAPTTAAAQQVFAGGSSTYGTLSIGTRTDGGCPTITGNNTFSNITITAPTTLCLNAASTQTITGAFNWAGSSGSYFQLFQNLYSGSPNGTATIHVGNAGSAMSWMALKGIVFNTNNVTCTNCFNLGLNSGTVTITAPSTGGAHIIGG